MYEYFSLSRKSHLSFPTSQPSRTRRIRESGLTQLSDTDQEVGFERIQGILNEYQQGFIDSLTPGEDVELEKKRYEKEGGLSGN